MMLNSHCSCLKAVRTFLKGREVDPLGPQTGQWDTRDRFYNIEGYLFDRMFKNSPTMSGIGIADISRCIWGLGRLH
jgi:hypothetical protein